MIKKAFYPFIFTLGVIFTQLCAQEQELPKSQEVVSAELANKLNELEINLDDINLDDLPVAKKQKPTIGFWLRIAKEYIILEKELAAQHIAKHLKAYLACLGLASATIATSTIIACILQDKKGKK